MTSCDERVIHRGQRYPRGRRDGKNIGLHKLLWEQAFGPVPEGLELHHSCENRACVNLDHLMLITHREHIRLHVRGEVCRNGLHQMTEENIAWTGRGERLCRACRDAAKRRHQPLRPRGPHRCTSCRQPGHNRRRCPERV